MIVFYLVISALSVLTLFVELFTIPSFDTDFLSLLNESFSIIVKDGTGILSLFCNLNVLKICVAAIASVYVIEFGYWLFFKLVCKIFPIWHFNE